MSQELRKLPPFAAEVMSKLQRFEECANDFEADGVDIGRDWLDTLTHLGLLDRTQRSPALWQTTSEGDALLEAYGPPAAMDESNFAPGGWKIEMTPDGGFCISHPTHGRGFFSDKGHKPAVIVSRFLDALLTYGSTAERLQAENAALQQRLNVADQRVDELEAALKFYADKDHYHFDEPDKWVSVSGEAENLLWHEEDPAYIEDGSVARNALKVRP